MGGGDVSGFLSEALGGASQISGVLDAGIDQISANQSIVFTKYVRTILPLDGFVFWVNAALLNPSPSAILNVDPLNEALFNQPQVPGPQVTMTIQGSFHYDVERRVLDDQTIDVNRCIFTAEAAIGNLDEIAPGVLWLGSFEDPNSTEGLVRFAFRHRQNFYQQAGKYHYVGDAVYPFMEPQIIDNLSQFDTLNVVVSNSLPIWLAFDQMNPPYPFPARQQVPLYPSFLVPDDVAPPYIAVHIVPESTQAITEAPFFDQTHSQTQFTTEKVEVTLYGLRNFNALDFMAYVQWMSEQYEAPFGVMNIPTMRDEKRPQTELSAIAMRKTVVYEINYYQSRVRNIAQALIEKVIVGYIIGD
jgi:hypothetical protein